MLTVATRNMVDAQWSKPGDLAARRLWAYSRRGTTGAPRPAGFSGPKGQAIYFGRA